MSELHSPALDNEVCNQIKKDFILAGFTFELSESFCIEEFIDFVMKSYAANGKQFKRLLYTFDFTEKQIGDALANLKNEEALIALSQLFVNKAKMKIAFRKKFSDKSLNLTNHVNLHNGIDDFGSESQSQQNG